MDQQMWCARQVVILGGTVSAGAYILENKYQPMSFGGKNMKRQKEKVGKCKRKRKKG
jgi:hypothetical protein